MFGKQKTCTLCTGLSTQEVRMFSRTAAGQKILERHDSTGDRHDAGATSGAQVASGCPWL